MKVDYYNRQGDTVVFEKINDDTVKMSNFDYYRTGFNTDGSTIEFIDPSGGPYISVGMNLNTYFETKEDMIIKAIEYEPENGLVLKI
jgi:hypothetical protein